MLKLLKDGSFFTIEIPGSVREIGDEAFNGCTSLSQVNIEEGVKVIGNGTFENCSSLLGIQIPSSVTEIGLGAFWNCKSLTFLVIPKGIKVIGEEAFTRCEGLEIGIYYHHDPSEPSYTQGLRNKYVYLLNGVNQRIGKLYILDEKTSKPEEEFSSRLISGLVNNLSEYDAIFSSIDEIVMRKSRSALCRIEYPLELLDEYKKSYITYLKKHAAMLVPFLIEKGDIASISILARVGVIPQENLSGYIDAANKQSRTELLAVLLDYQNKIHLPGVTQSFDLDTKKPSSDWVTYENEDGTLTISKYIGKEQDVTIPSMITGKKIKKIEGCIGSLVVSIFFLHRNLIQSVVIEDGIEAIGERAFLECTNLKSVEIPRSIAKIGERSLF